MHDIDHDLAPQNLKNLIISLAKDSLASIHSYNTRAAAAGKFHVIHYVQKSRTNPSQGLELEFGTKFLCCLNQNQKNYSKSAFRLNCCSLILVHEGVYADVYNLADELFVISS